MKKIILISLIIIALLSLSLNVYLVLENKRPILEAGRDWKANAIYKLPQKPGAYVLWEKDKVIHVGQSGNLRQRLYGHEKKKQMTSFDWYQTETTNEARQLEKKLKEELGYQGR